MDLILWRHAEAVDGMDDMRRVLTAKGRRQAANMAAWIQKRLPVTAHILVSPAVRTQQTAAALGLSFETVPDLAPNARPETVLKHALAYCTMAEADANEGTATVLIVGHQPTLGMLAASLMIGQPAALSLRKGEALWLRLNMPRSDVLPTHTQDATPRERPHYADQLTATLLAAMSPSLL
jgi:phosphohistidine phosphatase